MQLRPLCSYRCTWCARGRGGCAALCLPACAAGRHPHQIAPARWPYREHQLLASCGQWHETSGSTWYVHGSPAVSKRV